MVTMTDLCAELRNYFHRGCREWFGQFEIVDGSFTAKSGIELEYGQYYRIEGSLFNNGVHNFPDDLKDESFNGSVRAMAVPLSVIALLGDINKWEHDYGAETLKPYSSETIQGVYNYTRAAGGGGQSATVTWQDIFAAKLNRWRKI